MRKPFLLFLIFHLNLFYSQAQTADDYKCVKGTPYKSVDDIVCYYFSKGDEVLSVKLSENNVVIQKTNAKTLNINKVKEYPDYLKSLTVETVKEILGRYFLFYTSYKIEYEELFYQEIDFEKGELIGSPILLIKNKEKTDGSIGQSRWDSNGNMNRQITFGFYTSYDKSKLLVQYKLNSKGTEKEPTNNIVGFYVFDSQMKSLWKSEMELPYSKKKMYLLDYAVDKDANVYILSKVFENNVDEEQKNDIPNYHLEIFTLKGNVTRLQKGVMQLVSNVNKAYLCENALGDIICTGYYHTHTKEINVDGVFFFKVRSNANLGEYKSSEIPLSVLNQYVSQEKANQNEKKQLIGKANFELLSLEEAVINDDGSILLIGETQYDEYSNNQSSITPRSFNYDDLLVTKINEKGDVAWMQKIPKMQKRMFSRYVPGDTKKRGMSYRYLNFNTHHYFLFIDNPDNKELEDKQLPKAISDNRKGYLTAYKLNDETGSLKSYYLCDINDTKTFQFSTDKIIPIKNGDIVVEFYRRKEEDILIKTSLPK